MLKTFQTVKQCRLPRLSRLQYVQYSAFAQKLQKEVSVVEDNSQKHDMIVKDDSKEEEEFDDEKEFNLKQYIKLYKTLSKWNLSILNGIVTGSTAFICSGGALFGCTIPATIGCISLAFSASTINQLQEYKYDKLMLRTKLIRPLCNNKLTKNEAKIWSLLTMTIGISTLNIYCGTTSALIGLTTLLLYNGIYTPLKRKTPYNTEFGAIIGALPPQIGIAASYHYLNGNIGTSLMDVMCDPLCIYTFALLYIWQMPHFLYLNIRNKQDYIRGGFKMWSSVDDDDNNLCKRKSLIYSSFLLPLPLLMSYSNITSYMFAIDGTMLNTLYLLSVYKWYNNKQNNGKSSFYFNLIYLPAILFLMTIHSKRWKYKPGEFISTHLAYLQDKGIEYCTWVDVNDDKYESSQLPQYIVSCTSPFRWNNNFFIDDQDEIEDNELEHDYRDVNNTNV